jgi:two-component system chemotaxis response regulator CheY
VEAVKAGVSNYIVKPFTAEVLSEKIKKIIEKQ